jgi:deazaflavin-dependent oxidoreductase (nitroreductase family)
MSVKVTGKGTRGAVFPKFLAKLGNGFMVGRVRKGSARGAGGSPLLVLYTRGAKSGQERAVVLGYLEEGPHSWLIIASTSGASWNPSWLYNLAKDPDAAIELSGAARIDVRAETLEGEELTAAWKRIEAVAPAYAKYRTKTDREIPVVRLRTRATA